MVNRPFPAGRKDRQKATSKVLPKNGAVIYCRVSSEDQLQNFSISTQLKECKRFCERNQYTILRAFEEAASAKTASGRPVFNDMLRYCRQNRTEVGAVVVYTTTRFARSVLDHQVVKEELRSLGIRLLSVTEGFDDRTSEGRMMERLFSVLGQFDNEQRSDRTIAGMKTGLEAGKWMHKAPIGYLNASVAGGLVPDADRAELIRTAFALYAEGMKKNDVLRKVTALGLTNPANGKPVSAQTFDKLLRNPLYAGWIKSSWDIVRRGAFQPLVSEDLFRRVEARLDQGGERQTRSRMNEGFPLRVFMRCAACNTGLTGSESTGRGGKRYGNYTCYKPGCRAVKFRRDDLHSQFVSLLHSMFPRRELTPLFTEIVKAIWREKHEEAERLATTARQRVNDLKDKRQRLVDLFVDGQLDRATYDEQTQRVGTALEAAEAHAAHDPMGEQQLNSLLEFAEWMMDRLAGLWSAARYDKKQRIQRALFPNGLTVSREGLGTASISKFFKELEEIEEKELRMASPGGFEPPLPP
jgi:site-specific DNA recombinase